MNQPLFLSSEQEAAVNLYWETVAENGGEPTGGFDQDVDICVQVKAMSMSQVVAKCSALRAMLPA